MQLYGTYMKVIWDDLDQDQRSRIVRIIVHQRDRLSLFHCWFIALVPLMLYDRGSYDSVPCHPKETHPKFLHHFRVDINRTNWIAFSVLSWVACATNLPVPTLSCSVCVRSQFLMIILSYFFSSLSDFWEPKGKHQCRWFGYRWQVKFLQSVGSTKKCAILSSCCSVSALLCEVADLLYKV